MILTEQFWSGSLEEIKRGYTGEKDYYVCLLCGKRIEKGIVYPEEGVLYEAEKYMKLHIEKIHGSVFEFLVGMDKKLTGLTEHQKNLLQLFYRGKSDAQIQKEMGIGSSSTIRNHRFALKEKERQSKVYLAMMELLKEKDKPLQASASLQKLHSMIGGRYNVTQSEYESTLGKYYPQGPGSPLKSLPLKEKHRLVILSEITKVFDIRRIYSEKEINELLSAVYDDHVTLRRYLIEYGFLDRKADGSQYWLKGDSNTNHLLVKEEQNMDRKKELKQQYKEIKTEAGIYQIRNTINHKIFVISTANIRTMAGQKTQLNGGTYRNKELQEDWKEYGEEAFAFEVLELLNKKEDTFFDEKEELKKLEKKWLDKLQPYGERGYNK